VVDQNSLYPAADLAIFLLSFKQDLNIFLQDKRRFKKILEAIKQLSKSGLI